MNRSPKRIDDDDYPPDFYTSDEEYAPDFHDDDQKHINIIKYISNTFTIKELRTLKRFLKKITVDNDIDDKVISDLIDLNNMLRYIKIRHGSLNFLFKM